MLNRSSRAGFSPAATPDGAGGDVPRSQASTTFDQPLGTSAATVSDQTDGRNLGENSRTVDPLVDATQAATFLAISRRKLLELATKEELPAMRIGRLWRFRITELDAWVRSKLSSSNHPCREKRED